MIVAIDTNILVMAFHELETNHLQVVTSVDGRGRKVCHDHRSLILHEYKHNVGSLLAFRKWYQRLCQLQAIYYCCGKLPEKHRGALTRLGCHEPPDHVFIAVAYYSGKVLFTEDSDMGKGPRGKCPPHDQALAYLEGTLGLTVCDVGEALDLLSK
jgi:hypothetical protein